MKKRLIILTAMFIIFLASTTLISAKIQQDVFKEVNEKENARVIVVLNDISSKKGFSANFFDEELIKESQNKVFSKMNTRGKDISEYEKQTDFKIGNKFSTVNGFSGEVTKDGLTKLMNDPDVKAVYLDRKVYSFLDQSVETVNATNTWKLQVDSINLTGTGETICIIDSGIDYTHEALGNCTITEFNYEGINESYILESDHNYSNNFDYTWNITKPGYSSIAVHFKNISLEYQGELLGYDTYDRIIIYDSEFTEIAHYHGINGIMENIWTPHSEGDTIYIRLITDISFTDYGFYIDYILNGTTNTTYNWTDCSKVIDGWDFVNNDGDPMDDDGHGTHCAGIAASTDSTYRGVAPGSNLLSVKSLDNNGDGWTSDIIAGIDWCINNSERYNISVISMSLGSEELFSGYCDDQDPLTSNVINRAVGKNITVVVATGNLGSTTGISSPACIYNSTSVSSSSGDSIYLFANRNNITDLVAPGNSIHSMQLGGGFVDKTGTSMSAPHVAGAAAIIKQFMRLKNNIDILPAEIENILNLTGKEIDDTANTGRNYSRIDIYAAIMALNNTSPNQTTLISPSNNSFINLINMTWNESYDANGDIVYYYILVNGTDACFTSDLNCTYYPSEGFYQWNVTPYDGYVNGTTSESFFYTYDTTAPSYSDFGKNTSLVEVNDTVLFYSFWADNLAGLSHYVFSWNNSGTMENDTAMSLTLWSNITKKVNATNGSIVVWNIYANDTAGNWNSTGNQTFKIGNSAPTKPNITYPLNNSYTNTTILVNWTEGIDDDLDTVSYYVMFNNTQACFTTDLNCTYSPLEEGTYEIYIIPNDGYQNGDYSDSIMINYDTTKPTITSISSSSVTSSGATLTATTNEDATCRYSTTNESYFSMSNTLSTTGETSHSSALSGLSASTSYTYYVRCQDTAGNVMDFSNSTIFTTSSSGGSSSGGSSSTGVSTPTLNYEEKNIGTVLAGSTKSLVFYESDIYLITGIALKAKNRITNGKIRVEIASRPSGASSPNKKGSVYKYIEITKSNMDNKDIETVKINFKVEKSWIESKKYDFNSVNLHRYNNNVWEELDTERIGIGSDYYFYSAESPGLSTFAITSERGSSTSTATLVEDTSPEDDTEKDSMENEKPVELQDLEKEKKIMLPKFNPPDLSWLNWNWILIGVPIFIIFVFVQAKWNVMHIKVGLESESILALGGKIESANQLIKDEKIEEAKKLYLSTLKIYNALPEKEKKWAYKDINNLYKKINEKGNVK